MAEPVNYLRMAQSGGSPYDEEAYMRPGAAVSRELLGGMSTTYGNGPNRWLNRRLHNELEYPGYLTDYITGDDSLSDSDGLGYAIPSRYTKRNMRNLDAAINGGQSRQQGSDTDMMAMYGPEDQVAYDQQGRPIPLADPRHPNNQQQAPNALLQYAPMYPQRR